jgi:hypothetical protein
MKQTGRYLIILLLSLGYTLSGQETLECNAVDRPYQDGEEIVYKVYYNWGWLWIAAGEVIFKVEDKASEVVYTVTGRSFKAYDPIFMVRDYYVSHLDKTTCQPTFFRRDIHEGKYLRYDSISFDQQNHQLVEYFGKSKAEAQRFEFQLDDWVHDMVSVIYHLRSQKVASMEEGYKLPVRIFFDKELFSLDVNYIGQKRRRIKGLGMQSVYHFQPELIDGYVFSEGNLMDIWVSDDARQVPLLIESPINIGSVKAILQKYKPSRTTPTRDDYR